MDVVRVRYCILICGLLEIIEMLRVARMVVATAFLRDYHIST